METPATGSVEVRSPWDIRAAKLLAVQVATELGLNSLDRDEIALVISELGTNLVKHAGGGLLTVGSFAECGRTGIRIESLDTGPGISDIGQAMTDGFSSTSNLGVGLGAINRLMDKLEIISPVDGTCGTKIICSREVRNHVQLRISRCPLEMGVATRSHPFSEVNGDAFLIKHGENSVTLSVIDGLGHGEHARRAAWTAREYIERHYDQPLDSLFSGAGVACSGTRGVVMAIVRFSWESGLAQGPSDIRFAHASIGNIECKAFGGNPVHFIERRGVVGVNAPKPVVSSHSWDADMKLFIHSDGLRTNWRWSEFPELADSDINRIAAALLHKLGKEDDATVMVVRTKNNRGGGHD